MEQGKFYKLSAVAMEKMNECRSDLAIEYTRLNPDNEPFEVTSVDQDGNILAVLFGKQGQTRALYAEKGLLADYWCLWLAGMSELEQVNSAEAIEKIDPPDWFVMTTTTSGTTTTTGPMTEERARGFATSQCKNAAEGVRVLLLKLMAEAFLKVEIK